MVRLSHFNCHNDPYLPSDNSPSDDDSDTEVDRHDEGKVAGVAPPPGLAELHDGAQPQPVNEKKRKKAMKTSGELRLVRNKNPQVGDPNDRTCLPDSILNILPKKVSRLLVK